MGGFNTFDFLSSFHFEVSKKSVSEQVLVLLYLSPKKSTFSTNFLSHQIGPNWTNGLRQTTVGYADSQASKDLTKEDELVSFVKNLMAGRKEMGWD